MTYVGFTLSEGMKALRERRGIALDLGTRRG
jgi:hypothetical protein